jgi:hypothetical protein
MSKKKEKEKKKSSSDGEKKKKKSIFCFFSLTTSARRCRGLACVYRAAGCVDPTYRIEAKVIAATGKAEECGVTVGLDPSHCTLVCGKFDNLSLQKFFFFSLMGRKTKILKIFQIF